MKSAACDSTESYVVFCKIAECLYELENVGKLFKNGHQRGNVMISSYDAFGV